MATLRSPGVLKAPMSFACLVTRKRPSSEKWVWMASSSTCFTSPARTVLAALRARSMKSVLCAAMPMLWNFWSEKSGLTVEKAWQSPQRQGSPVRVLRRGGHRVQDRGAVALRTLGGRGYAVGHRLVVGEDARGVVAGGARHLVVDREALVVEQLVAERGLVRRWRRRGRDGKLVEDGGDAPGEPPLQRGGEPGGERRACEHETLPADQHGPSFRITASVYSTSTARRGAGLLPRVAAHQLGLAERVPPDGLQERRLGRAGRKLGDGVQRVEPEGVAVRRTARRTGPAVPGAAEVVRALPAAVVQRRRGPHALGEAGGARRHAVQHPVHPGARGRVGVVAHEREALRPRRRIGPGERG